MRDGLTENLRSIFAGEEAVFLTDEHRLADWLTAYGLQAKTFDDLLADGTMPRQAVAVPLDYGRLPSRRALRDMLSATSVLWMSLASFSSDVEEAKYAVERLAEVDVVHSVAKNRRIISQLLLAREAITLSGPGTALKVDLPEVLQLASRTRLRLLPDEHSTIGNYFEVVMSPTDLAGRVDSELSVSGTLRVDSVLVAKHRELQGERGARFAEATAAAAEMRRACPLYLSIRDNRIVDGLDRWADGINALSGPEYRGAVTEVAIGTGVLPADHVDWSLNCLLNESAAGIHLGVGNGLTGMHFDFISTKVALDGT